MGAGAELLTVPVIATRAGVYTIELISPASYKEE
jgi:hypothetical protein